MSLKAAAAWKNNARIALILLVSAAVVAGVAYYKTTSKEIMPLFLLQAMSMLLAINCLPAILSFPKNETAKKTLSQVSSMHWMINLGFVMCFASALMGKSAVKCDPDGGPVIPWGFFATFSLFMLHWLYVSHLHKNKFYIKWQPNEKKE